jgi:WD40 repeat protein
VKDNHRITSLAFRPAASKDDEGRFVWCGVKDGHLFEFDAWNGTIRDVRPNAHVGAVTHIMRYGRRMVTVCDAGKAYVFSPSEEGADLNLSRPGTGMRYLRISEKQGFAKVFGHQLWTANGSGNNGVGGATASRGPTIRVYNLASGANGPTGTNTVVPSDPVGQVICGTILPSRPDKLYLGHEGGTITIWNRDRSDNSGAPTHSGTIKVGTSDVLSLEGVPSCGLDRESAISPHMTWKRYLGLLQIFGRRMANIQSFR